MNKYHAYCIICFVLGFIISRNGSNEWSQAFTLCGTISLFCAMVYRDVKDLIEKK